MFNIYDTPKMEPPEGAEYLYYNCKNCNEEIETEFKIVCCTNCDSENIKEIV